MGLVLLANPAEAAFPGKNGKIVFDLLLMLMAALVMVGGTALAYTTSKKVSLKLDKPNYVVTALTSLVSNAVGLALTLETDSTDPGATPLKLDTETSFQAPTSVGSSTKGTDPDADQLAGKSEADFASLTHNRDTRYFTESEVSNGFIQMRGTAQHRAVAFSSPRNDWFWQMRAIFPSGSHQLEPVGSQAHPTGEFWSQEAAGPLDPQAPNAPHPLGEHISFQVHSTSFVANIEVHSVHRTSENNCHVQAQALVTRP